MFEEDVEFAGTYEYENDLIIKTNAGELTIKKGVGKTLTVVNYEGKGIDISSEISYLIEDDNFLTNDAQISEITGISDTNYSAGKIEDSASYANLTNDTLAAAYTYSDKK